MKKSFLYSIVLGVSTLFQLTANAGGYLYCVATKSENRGLNGSNDWFWANADDPKKPIIPAGDKNVYSYGSGIWIEGYLHTSPEKARRAATAGDYDGIRLKYQYKDKAEAENFCKILQNKCKNDHGENFSRFVGAFSKNEMPLLWLSFNDSWLYLRAEYPGGSVVCDNKEP